MRKVVRGIALLIGLILVLLLGGWIQKKYNTTPCAPCEQAKAEPVEEDPTPAPCTPHDYTVVTGNTLSGIFAAKYPGEANEWWKLHKANEDKIRDSHWIYPGQVLTIPCFDDLPDASAPVEQAVERIETPKTDIGTPAGKPVEVIQGQQGDRGLPGINCWDLNGNRQNDPEEDRNRDGQFNALDCQGPQGQPGRVVETPPAAPPAPTITITANPNPIEPSQLTTLAVKTTNATSVVITPAVGPIDPNGSIRVAPSETRTYTARATGPGGENQAEVTVVVNLPKPPPPPIVVITATPLTIEQGQPTTLQWEAIGGTDSLTITNLGPVPLKGSREVTPGSTTTFTAEAVGKGGRDTDSVTVTVNLRRADAEMERERDEKPKESRLSGSVTNLFGNLPTDRSNWVNRSDFDLGVKLRKWKGIEFQVYGKIREFDARKDTQIFSWDHSLTGEGGLRGAVPFEEGTLNGSFTIDLGLLWQGRPSGLGKPKADDTLFTQSAALKVEWDNPTKHADTTNRRLFPGSFYETIRRGVPFEGNNMVGGLGGSQGIVVAKKGRFALVPGVFADLTWDKFRKPWNNRIDYGGVAKVSIRVWDRGEINILPAYSWSNQYHGTPVKGGDGHGFTLGAGIRFKF